MTPDGLSRLQTFTHNIPRCPRDVNQYNRSLDHWLRRRTPSMNLRRWKAIKIMLLNIALFPFATFIIVEGGDPTLIGGLSIATIALLNGIEIAELATAWSVAAGESRSRGTSNGDSDDA